MTTEKLKAKAVRLLDLQDELFAECKKHEAGYIFGNQEAVRKYVQTDNKLREISQKFSEVMLATLQLSEMEYAMANMGTTIHLN